MRHGPRFPPAHRGGDGPPLVLLHGFTGSWRMWEHVLTALERRHDVLAPILPVTMCLRPSCPAVPADRRSKAI